MDYPTLENKLNTCYANTGVLALLHLDSVKEVLDKVKNQDLEEKPLTKELLKLSTTRGSTNLDELRKLVTENTDNARFDTDLQQDVADWVGNLANQLSEESSEFKEVFCGVEEVQRECLSCGRLERGLEAISYPVAIPVFHETHYSNDLSVMLENESRDQSSIDKFCESCSPEQNVSWKVSRTVCKAPPEMMVLIKRFIEGPEETIKLPNPIHVSAYHTIATQLEGMKTYKLSSFICHEGYEAKTGHYTVTFKNDETNEYTTLDDQHGVTQVTHRTKQKEETLINQSYMVFLSAKKEHSKHQEQPHKADYRNKNDPQHDDDDEFEFEIGGMKKDTANFLNRKTLELEARNARTLITGEIQVS